MAEACTIGVAVFPLLTALNRAWLLGCTYSNQLLIKTQHDWDRFQVKPADHISWLLSVLKKWNMSVFYKKESCCSHISSFIQVENWYNYTQFESVSCVVHSSLNLILTLWSVCKCDFSDMKHCFIALYLHLENTKMLLMSLIWDLKNWACTSAVWVETIK